MKKRKNYASKLTKDELIKSGITLVTEDGYVFKGDKQITPSIDLSGYFVFAIYELDENGEKIKKPIKRQFKGCKKISDTYVYVMRTVGLHRIMWAWFHDEVPEGYVVDHINNKHEEQEDYRLENLQLLTPAQNLNKERGESTKQLKCKLNKPLSFYECKLDSYLAKYNEAKKNHDAELAHKLRSNIADAKARIRYYKAHIEEANALKAEAEEKIANKDAYHVRAARIKELNDLACKARSQYLQAQHEYGDNHLMTLSAKKEWRAAVAERNEFLEISDKKD